MASELKLEVGKFYIDESGHKTGPIRYYKDGFFDLTDEGPKVSWLWSGDGEGVGNPSLIAEWTAAPTGPVRTVTRKEIVFGVHGDIEIVEDDTRQGGIGIYINATMNAARIRDAANSMLAVADAMEEGQ